MGEIPPNNMEGVMPEPSNFDHITNVLDKLIIYLRRPLVQIQLLAVVVVVGVAFFLDHLIWTLLDARLSAWIGRRRQRRTRSLLRFIAALIKAITFSALALILLAMAQRFLARQGVITGILDKVALLFGVILVFQIGITILYPLFDDDLIRKYHHRLFIPLLIVLIILAILGNLTDLRGLANTVIAVLFDHPITLGLIFVATIGFYFWAGGAQAVEDLVYQITTHHTRIDPGGAKAALTLMRYILILIGIAFILSQLQLNAATVAAITGGLSVGIGFGLREILSNFISGIFLLIERSLQPGDVIEVDNEISVVENVQIRATTVRTLNNDELVIPNQTFFTSSFKTYTGTDKKVRVPVILRTDCAIQPNDVIDLLIETAFRHPDVLHEPKPSVFLLEYGDNVATFQLNVWLDNPVLRPKVTSDLKLKLWDAFAVNNIALPFPEIELHLPRQMVPELRPIFTS